MIDQVLQVGAFTPDQEAQVLQMESIVDQLKKYKSRERAHMRPAYRREFAKKSKEVGEHVSRILQQAARYGTWT